ncbi:MAG: histidinol dehydrogenase [Leptospiraceae bacterium]|nr:histidinol dehydrogenase [Leptospiraceae bacterium]
MAIKIKKLNIKNDNEYKEILRRAKGDISEAFDVVIPILKDVEKNGDEAIRRYTEKFDKIQLNDFRIHTLDKEANIPEDWKIALEKAKSNIRQFHATQLRMKTEVTVSGNRLGVKYTPVESVAVYAPGGKALYPSSVLMGAIPAKIAGVKNISLITPPSKDGGLNPVLLYAAQIAGVDTIYTVGGAQGIAGLAFGTETITKAEFIVGPGNRYVTAAKSYLAGVGQIGIESPAGPSEVLIIADKTSNPEWIACDMLSQAEHGEDSVAILCTDSEELAIKVDLELKKALSERPKRREMKERAIDDNSYILIFPNIEECIDFSNLYAPEHLEIMTSNYDSDFEKIIHAGSVFLGQYSPVAMGDYISGTNHVLPTAGGSRIYSSLGVDTFLKRVTYQEIRRESLKELYPFVKTLSEIEGLDEEHGTSVYLRTL